MHPFYRMQPQPKERANKNPQFMRSSPQQQSFIEEEESDNEELTGAYTTQLQQRGGLPFGTYTFFYDMLTAGQRDLQDLNTFNSAINSEINISFFVHKLRLI